MIREQIEWPPAPGVIRKDWPHQTTDAKWAGGNLEDACRFATQGDVKSVEEARSRVDRIMDGLDLETYGRVQCDAIAGGSVNVGRYLAGAPDCMRGWVEDDSNKTPIRIVVGCVSAAGVPHSTLMARGMAATALAIALSPYRAVTLEALWAVRPELDYGGKKDQDVVSTCVLPMYDLSACAAALCQTVMSRGWIYARHTRLAGGRDLHLAWPKESEMVLGNIQPGDLLVPSPRLADNRSPAEWVEWVRGKLDLLLKGEQVETAHGCDQY